MNLNQTPFTQKQFSGTDVQGNLSIYTVIKATYDFNNKGELQNIVVIDTDISASKNIEEQLNSITSFAGKH